MLFMENTSQRYGCQLLCHMGSHGVATGHRYRLQSVYEVVQVGRHTHEGQNAEKARVR